MTSLRFCSLSILVGGGSEWEKRVTKVVKIEGWCVLGGTGVEFGCVGECFSGLRFEG